MPLPTGNKLAQIFAAWGARLTVMLGIALICTMSQARAETRAPLRLGVTPVVVHDQHKLLQEWADYLASRLGRPVEIVSRDRYSDTLEMLGQDKLDVAWVSTYPYILLRSKVRLVATPIFQGKPTYRAYLIVAAGNTGIRSILQLKGTVFAFADPISHSGYLIPRHELTLAGQRPSSFFRKTFFTWGHSNSIEAVAHGLADAAYVDSYVWDSLQKITPELTKQTRIASRTIEYAFPPIVAQASVSAEDFQHLQQALLGMAMDPVGKALLQKLNLDGFTRGSPGNYDPVEQMMRAVKDK